LTKSPRYCSGVKGRVASVADPVGHIEPLSDDGGDDGALSRLGLHERLEQINLVRADKGREHHASGDALLIVPEGAS